SFDLEIPSCADGDRCLGVLTFNMRHRDVPLQLHALAQGLRADLGQLPDFILCQEVVFDRPRAREHEDTAADLASLLDYEVRGTPRRSGLEGLAILSRHPFDHYAYLHLEARDGFFSGGFPRVSIMGEFQVASIGRVRVVNVHLAYRRSRNETRREQLRETLAWMADRQHEVAADVIVLGGDFNIEPQWDEFDVLEGWQDYNSDTPTLGRPGKPHRRVDYFFVAAPDRVVDSVGEGILWPDGLPTVDGAARFWVSDHLLLLHVFSLGPET
ncbi:MAG: endonuclease/exonuclease/phosphatase family protein, partial [Planctomycetota bacterium]